MGTSSLTLQNLSTTTAQLWTGAAPILVAAFSLGVGFFIIFALIHQFRKSATKALR